MQKALNECPRGLRLVCAQAFSRAHPPSLTAHLSLRGDPGVFQTLGSRGSFLRQQLQHG